MKELFTSLLKLNKSHRRHGIVAILFFISFQSYAQLSMSIGSYIDAAKVKNGTVLIYTAKGKHKLYGTFKDNALVSFYAVDNKGNRLKNTSALTVTTCEVCVIQNGVTTCYNCKTTDTQLKITTKKENAKQT